LPDYLSVFRIVVVPVLGLLILQEQRLATGLLLAAGLASDALDGYLARKWQAHSRKGTRLDSNADMLIGIAGIVAFYRFENTFFLDHLFWISLGIGLYLIQLVVSLFRFRKTSSFHTCSAKLTVILMTLFLVPAVLGLPLDILFYPAFLSMIAEGLEETTLLFLVRDPEHEIKGVFWLK
jgi:phosphatidylglycerophosphate synthase